MIDTMTTGAGTMSMVRCTTEATGATTTRTGIKGNEMVAWSTVCRQARPFFAALLVSGSTFVDHKKKG